MRLLVVEDDCTVRDFVARALRQAGYVIDVAGSAHSAEALTSETAYDALVVDLGLPDGDGLDFIASCRGRGVHAPVLILSARRSAAERVRGLEGGGDDYLIKPFALAELLARIRNMVRRSNSLAQPSQFLQAADLELNVLERTARRDGKDLQLTQHEFMLLEFLLRNAGRVVTRTMILDGVWKMRIDPKTNVVEVHMHRLRGKVDGDAKRPLIRTVRGAGYALVGA
jgi:DNA-binding response OmpR family regulator